MKCPNCNGVPYDEVWTCEVCNGKGVVEPLSNEEWLKQCTTEQLAEWLSKIEQPFPCNTFLKCDKSCGLSAQCCGDDVEPTDKERWEEWLKQPHTKGDSE